jgi:beta propeller repeat protein
MMNGEFVKTRLLLVCVVSIAVIASAGVAYGQWLLPEKQVTTNTEWQRWPEVSGTKVVFEDYRDQREVGDPYDPDTLFDIYVLDLNTMQEKNLTPYHTATGKPAISGNYVVWTDYGHGSAQGGIYFHDLSKGTTRRLPISSGREVEISGSRVTYEAFRGNWRVYVFDIKTNTEKRITTDDAIPGAPDISGTKVVWQDFRDGNHEIYAYDLATGNETRVTNNPGRQTLPRISGNRIVWIDDRNGPLNDDIYLYDLGTETELQVTDAPGTQWFPAVSSGRVVWLDERNGNTDIYLYDVATGVETQVTSDPSYQGNVAIAGNRIVYEDYRRSDPDIYLTEIAAPKFSAASRSVIPYGTQAKVTGKLLSATGVPMSGKTVQIEVSKDKKTWTRGGTATTTASGAYSLLSTRFATRRYLRVRFSGDTDFPAAVSNTVLVKARVYFSSAPRLHSTSLRTYTTYKVWGYLKPKHRSGSTWIKIRAYRYERRANGTYGYVYKKTFSTRTSNPAGYSYTKYTGYVKLPRTGRWRLRAYHAEDTYNAANFSSYRYVTVRARMWEK